MQLQLKIRYCYAAGFQEEWPYMVLQYQVRLFWESSLFQARLFWESSLFIPSWIGVAVRQERLRIGNTNNKEMVCLTGVRAWRKGRCALSMGRLTFYETLAFGLVWFGHHCHHRSGASLDNSTTSECPAGLGPWGALHGQEWNLNMSNSQISQPH